MIHLPLCEFPQVAGIFGLLMKSLYATYRIFSSMKADLKRKLCLKTTRGTPYSINTLNYFLADIGFKNIEFRIFPLKSNGSNHFFAFASK